MMSFCSFVSLILPFVSSQVIRLDRNPNYRWTVLPELENLDVCNNNTCGHDIHTICRPKNFTSPNCKNFSLLPLEFVNIQKFVLMHNGLRNRIVRSKKSYAKNMNYLHWDQDLAAMAVNWIHQCRIGETDVCDYIYQPPYTVGQNHVFIKGIPGDDWELKAMSEWFIEIQQLESQDFDSITAENANNFTQMMWATSQFLGCAGARMFNGFLVTCYYHPAGNRIGSPVFKRGKHENDACTECSESRSSCSRILTGLCGLDDKYTLQNCVNLTKTMNLIDLILLEFVVFYLII